MPVETVRIDRVRDQVFLMRDRFGFPPCRFRRIQILYRFTGRNLNENQICRAIVLTESKYCSTHATLREVVQLTSEYRIFDLEEG